MTFWTHNIYHNIRTRAIVVHNGALLLLPPHDEPLVWRPPGGGLEPGESLADCVRRELLEETGLRVEVGRVAFLREWVAPTYCTPPDGDGRHAFGLEVFVHATVVGATEPQPETPADPTPIWVPLMDVPQLTLWPTELKSLALLLARGEQPSGIHSFVTDFEPATMPTPNIEW